MLMGDAASIIATIISTVGVVGAGWIAARAQRASNAMRASLDAATAQTAAQAALYDGYGDLSGHYRTLLGDLDAQLATMQMAARSAVAECDDCRAELAALRIECAKLRNQLDTLGGHP